MDGDRPQNTQEPRVTPRYDESAACDTQTVQVASHFADVRTALNPGGVTQRFPEGPVTDRFVEHRATLRMPETQKPSRVERTRAVGVGLTYGELVGDRYRVEEGPLQNATGEGFIYRCVDTQSREDVALKFYHENIAPKETILKSLLKVHHPHVVTLQSYGTWQGRFYEVMDFCLGGSLMEHAPYDEAMLEVYLGEIVEGLHYLHASGVVHRDIKPNNLLFRKPDRQEVVIGDFGVSSLLDSGEDVRMTSTGAFFTLDYAAPELLDGKQVGPKTDFYAVGITLLHLFFGKSPFAGMDKNTILGCHFRGKVPRPAELTKRFATLINGLVRVSPEKRWGYSWQTSWTRS